MLYIDQPVQTGFSYDYPINGTVDPYIGEVTPLESGDPIPVQNNTFLVGTFPSQNPANTANTTTNAARYVFQLFVRF